MRPFRIQPAFAPPPGFGYPIPVIAPVQKPETFRPLGAVDVAALIAAVGKVPDGFWTAADAAKQNAFPCFQHTLHIIFRFVDPGHSVRDWRDLPLWSAWQGLLLPVMQQAIAPYGFTAPQFPKAMLARLAAGQRINPHRDSASNNRYCHKIHVPLFTNPQATLLAGETERHLPVGEACELNNLGRHAARNDGATDRIHFIFEVFDRVDG